MSAAETPWIAVVDRLPPVGKRVLVRHARSPGYDCDGEIDANGVWHCSNGFIYPHGGQALITFNPTHWMPRDQTDPAGPRVAA